MSDNTVHYPEDEDKDKDNMSVQSGGSDKSSVSISKLKHQCPHCPKELQTTNLFRHIRLQHDDEFGNYMAVWDIPKLEEMLNTCQPFPMEWTSTNDFDETVEHKFFGCLCCNNTFTNKPRALAHVKNKKCKAKHLSELKGIIKQEKANVKTRKTKAKPKPWPILMKDLELEIRRYKYLIKVGAELNCILDEMIANGRAEPTESRKKVPLITFDLCDYGLPANLSGNIDLYEPLMRLWSRRVGNMDDAFCKLRDWLYYYSFSKVERYKVKGDNHEKGQFIGYSFHDTVGPIEYPALTDIDASLIQKFDDTLLA
jgi:hypothetical protein